MVYRSRNRKFILTSLKKFKLCLKYFLVLSKEIMVSLIEPCISTCH